MGGSDAVAAVRAYARSGRRRRSRPWYDRYIVVFAVAVLAVFVARPAWAAVARLSAARADPSVTGLMLVVLAFVVVLAMARTFGPIVVSPPDAQWLVPSPLDRREVLRPAAVRVALVSVVLGGALGVATLVVLGVPGDVPLRLVTAAVLGMSLTVAGMSGMALLQRSDASGGWPTTALAVLALSAGLVALAAHSGRLPGLRGIGVLARLPATAGAVAALCAAAGAAVLARSVWRSLRRFPARAVLEASVRLGTTANMTIGLEPALVAGVAEDAYWRRRALRSRRWPRLPAAAALAWQDWRTLGRRPKRLLALVLSAAVPTLATPQDARPGLPLLAVLLAGALAAASSGTSGARRDAGDVTLRRLMAISPGALAAARAVLPALLAALWLTVALAGLAVAGAMPAGVFSPALLVAAPALGAAALRMAGRGPIDHGLAPLDTPFGPLPSGLLLWAVTGLDLACAGCAPLLWAVLTHAAPAPGLIAVQAVTACATLAGYLTFGRRVS